MKFLTTITLYLIFSSILLSNSSRVPPALIAGHSTSVKKSDAGNSGTNSLPCVKKDLSSFKRDTMFPNPFAKGASRTNLQQLMENDKKVCNLADLKKEYQEELDALATILNPNNPDVCWRKGGTEACPLGYKECGMQCAKNSWECAKSVVTKVYKVTTFFADITVTVASFGSYSALKAGIRTASKAAIEGIRNLATHVGKEVAKDFVKKVAKNYVKELPQGVAESKLEQAITQGSTEPGWSDLSVVDPTGISDIVLAFWDAMCSNVTNAKVKKVARQ